MILKRIWYYFRLCRPIYWPLALIMIYSGVIIGNNGLPTDWITTMMLFLLGILFSSSAFSWNQIFDAESDRMTSRRTKFGPIPNKSLPVASKKISKKNALVFSSILGISSIFFSLTFNVNVFLVILFSLLLHIFYSTPPIRLKGRTPFDAITNAIGFGILSPLLGVLAFSGITYEILFLLPVSFIFALGVYIPTTIVDYDFDKKFKIKTFAVRHGIKKSAKWSTLIQLLGIFFMLILFYMNFYPKIILSFLPFSLIFLISTLVIYISPSSRTTVLAYSPALLSVMIGLPLMLTLTSIV